MSNDTAFGREGLSIGAHASLPERGLWQPVWTVTKYVGDFAAHVATALAHLRDASPEEVAAARYAAEQDFLQNQSPYATVVVPGNILVTVGITLLWNLLAGNAGTSFSNGNARLGVGNSNAAEAIGQTDLQGASNLRKAMNATYPTVATNVITFQSTFASAEANFTWLEVGTFNSAAGATMLNRKVPVGGLGTKASGASWTLTETITLS